MIIEPESREEAARFLSSLITIGLDFKLQDQLHQAPLTEDVAGAILTPLPSAGISLDDLTQEFRRVLLPYCVNVAAPGYMSYPYVGNSIAGVGGEVLDALLQQNLMNQDWSPSATLAEITLVQWLRDAIGYPSCYKPRSIHDIGGTVTVGGTSSNAIAMLLARERRFPGSMAKGVRLPARCGVIVPSGVWHHTIAEAKKWIGCGGDLIEVATDRSFRMDLSDLSAKLSKHRGQVMAVVAYAGNSRTMTIDRLELIAEVTRHADPRIWLHADACFGFSLAFSDRLRPKLKGLQKYDSVTTDPHKVLNVPYPLSVVLVKDPADMGLLVSPEAPGLAGGELSLGLITPFLGSRSWLGLKAWFALKNYGTDGLAELIESRHRAATELAQMVAADEDLLLVGEVDVNAVLFFYSPERQITDVATLNALSAHIHDELRATGAYELHRPRLPDPGIFQKGAMLRPLRYMSGNQRITSDSLAQVIDAVKASGENAMKAANG